MAQNIDRSTGCQQGRCVEVRYSAPWLHPIQIAGIIRRALEDQPQKLTAKTLGISPQYLCDILKARRALSPEVACRLHEFGLDGLGLLMAQTIHSYHCAAYHDEMGDPAAKAKMDQPDFCMTEASQ